MPILNLNDLKVGMVIAKPVKVQGRVIIGAGATLTDKVLHLFKTWGVTEAEIADESIGGPGEEKINLSEEELKKINEAVDYRFKTADVSEEIMAEVRRIAVKKEVDKVLQKKLSEEKV